MKEIWKDIEGYEGLYQVSNLGRVRSLNWRNTNKIRGLFLKKHNKGYKQVELSKEGKRKTYLVHRLVAQAFLSNENNYPFVNHIDENPLNNMGGNLEWCNQNYNVKYSINLHPERSKRRKSKKFGAYKHFKKVLQIDKKTNKTLHEWTYISEIVRTTGWHNTSLTECCFGKRKTAYGYKWQFASEYQD